MFNTLNEKTRNLASTVWQNANIATVKTALETARAVASGIGYTISKQAAKMMDWNQKLKETFACYELRHNGKANVGTIYFTRNGLVFSCEDRLPQHIKDTKRDLPLPPPGEKSWEDYYKREKFWNARLTIEWEHIREIKIGGNMENPSEIYIQIRTAGSDHIFMGFLNHQKAFAHLYSLLESSSWS